MNRYFSIVGNVFVTILNLKTLPPQRCETYDSSHQIFIIVNQSFVCGESRSTIKVIVINYNLPPIQVLLILRTWALYGRNSRILLLMIGSSLILLGVAAWSQVGQNNTYAPGIPGCNVAYANRGAIQQAAAWEGLLLFDSLVFILTILKTYRGRNRHHFISSRRFDIVSLVLRDGAVYYAIMVLSNLANIATFYIARPALQGCLASFTSCLSVTMMSRLMLNLHTAANTGIFSTAPTSDTSIGVAFTSHAPDNLPFEMQSTMPTQSLQATAELIVQEMDVPEMDVEQTSRA